MNEKIEQFWELYADWNSKINLSAIRTKEDFLTKHIEDSLLPTSWFDFQGKKILDLGTGGGFPSLPLALYLQYPSLNFVNTTQNQVRTQEVNVTEAKKFPITALDAIAKKLKVVQTIATELGVEIETLHGRAEDFGRDKLYRDQFDVVVTRAVAKWPTLLELALPFVAVGGYLLAYQGPAVQESLVTYKGLEKKFGAKLVKVVKGDVADSERVFVLLKKIKSTPKRFPRPAGIPKKEPLQG